MKIIKTVGLLLFIGGFILFNALIFWGRYELTETAAEQKIPDKPKAVLFKNNAETLFRKSVLSQFTFVSELHAIFHSINEDQLKLYSITDNEVDRIVLLSRDVFSFATVDSAFN
jgi:hypothetical protein